MRLALLTAPGFLVWAAAAAQTGQGHLEARIVVIEDLVPKPVALVDFQISGSSGGTTVVRTDLDGRFRIDLDPGKYVLGNPSPVAFKGKQYTWSKAFEVKAGATTSLTLTDADASAKDVAPTRVVSDEAKLYQRFKRSLVTVDGDKGSGSGFLVDARGLVLTNAHVVEGSTFLAVRIAPGERYEAKVLAIDSKADVAVLQVDPRAFAGIECLPLLPSSEALGVEGEKIMAVGSPLGQEKVLTQGIISKVEPDVLISDVNINHGNSGGPVMNMAGMVIGIATFIDPGTPNGPGISGVIAIRKADGPLAEARQLVASQAPPDGKRLPDVSPVAIPDEVLQSVAWGLNAKDPRGNRPFYKAPKNFRTYVVTPFEVVAAQLRFDKEWKKKIARRYKGGVIPPEQDLQRGPSRFWERYVDPRGPTQPLVVIQAIPWPQETSASAWNRALWGSAVKAKFELRDDFARMVLLRNGVEVVPIYRNKSRDTAIYDGFDVEINDTALAGVYSYDPRAFAPGAEMDLRVWKNDQQDFTSIKIDADAQKRIWEQFQQWAELAKSKEASEKR